MQIYENVLTAQEFFDLYSSVGWEPPSLPQIQLALDHSYYTICIKEDGKPIGMGRVIGDGALCFYIKSLAILPVYQGRGIGRIIIQNIMNHIKSNLPKGFKASVELISAKDKELFYEKFGFVKQPNEGRGHGMMAVISNQ